MGLRCFQTICEYFLEISGEILQTLQYLDIKKFWTLFPKIDFFFVYGTVWNACPRPRKLSQQEKWFFEKTTAADNRVTQLPFEDFKAE